jgi:phosphoglycolate phosphatase
MLADLAAAGLYLAVVSNKMGPYLRTEAEILGWDRLFGRLVGAMDAEADKPHAAPVHMALSESGIVPGPDVWFVGDSAIDMHCAANSGCVPILMRPEPPGAGEFDGHPPMRHLDTCKALARLADELRVPISGE